VGCLFNFETIWFNCAEIFERRRLKKINEEYKVVYMVRFIVVVILGERHDQDIYRLKDLSEGLVHITN
jgi:hypothetical protein